MTKEIHRGGCLHCPGSQDVLSPDTVLYNDFGGYTVKKNGDLFYEGMAGDWESFETLAGIEKTAKENPGHWTVTLNSALRGATWTRNVYGEWILTETNQGFA